MRWQLCKSNVAKVAAQRQQRQEQSKKAFKLVEVSCAFGAWPREHARSDGNAAQPASSDGAAQPAASDDATQPQEKERLLARRLRDARAAGWLTHEEDGGYVNRELDAIVNEMYWTSQRQREQEALEKAAA